jgi:hypothetical protein
VLYAAADAEPEIAAAVALIDDQRLTGAAMLARTVVERRGGGDPDEIRDSIWVFNALTMYGMLVVQRGWSSERYRDWLRKALLAVVR